MAASIKNASRPPTSIMLNGHFNLKSRSYKNWLNLLLDDKIWHSNIFLVVAISLLIFEAIFNVLIIWNVPYTEIDWKAYMQEVEGYLYGEKDYKNLKGDTGPLVYPAGFLYIFSILYRWTSSGTNLRLAQYLYTVLYVATHSLIFYIIKKTKAIPPAGLVLYCLSKRLHSLYVLRLFNDPVAMIFLYACIIAIIHKRWTISAILFSFAVSIKMNILLFAPAYAIIIYDGRQLNGSFLLFTLFLFIQLVLGFPFLTHHASSYIQRAFDFHRIFMYKWTVNWKFLNETTFLSPLFGPSLIFLLVISLIIFADKRWCRQHGGLLLFIKRGLKYRSTVGPSISSLDAVTFLFTSNLIGILWSRSLHYQFYSWYFHTIPFLLWRTRFPNYIRLIVFFALEWSWNIYPANSLSSSVLFICNMSLILGVWLGKSTKNIYKEKERISERNLSIKNRKTQ